MKKSVLLFLMYIATAANAMTIQEQIDFLDPLCTKLLETKTQEEKLSLLASSPHTMEFLSNSPALRELLAHSTSEEQLALLTVAAIGQGPYVLYHLDKIQDLSKWLDRFSKKLAEVEQFYASVGGIAGYHLMLLKLIQGRDKVKSLEGIAFAKPPGLDITGENRRRVQVCTRWGIESMPEMAEIYPVGGAGDRLNLKDPETGKPLPAALLSFCGRSLLEGLIRDLQGREYLYYKLFGRQLTLPIALMTSHEKENDRQIRALFQDNECLAVPRSVVPSLFSRLCLC